MLEIRIIENAPDSHGPILEENRVTITDDEKKSYLALMREQVARMDDTPLGEPLETQFDVENGEKLFAKIWRFGKSASALWCNLHGERATPVAVSFQLMGYDGAADVAAVDAILKHDPPYIGPKSRNSILAEGRPFILIKYFDGEWLTNRRIELAAGGLMLALVAPLDASPTIEPVKPQTPEEHAEMMKKAQTVGDIFGLIHNDWVKRKTLKYTVRSSEKVMGRPIAAIMNVKFWVGVMGQGAWLDINQTVAVFEMLADQMEQLKGSKYLKKVEISSVVKLRHSTQQIRNVLSQITITEPD